ncbi:MAG: dienelactone hydrolase family protein [Enhydrobacter sp.]|nr:MAG: dienelactone hydrolase family protein [Enhydrobacter sp.]
MRQAVAYALSAMFACASPALSQERLKVELISRTPSGPTELMAGEGKPATVVGWLTVPMDGPSRKPAMVIAHGSGGILDGRENSWASRLNALGVATLVVDSFTPRGLTSTGEDQSRLPTAANVADAFAALSWLASRSDIDPARIGVMGFSKGGQVAIYTALEPFRRRSVADGLRFALHIALYPSCSIPYVSREVTKAPMVFLLGGADDYTPAAHCARYIDFFRDRGAAVTAVTFADAHHGFDVPTRRQTLARAQTARKCGLDIELEPVAGRRWDTGATIAAADIGAYLRSCMERGATFGGDAAALAGAIAQVEAAVSRYLK